jgi:uncharacterized protein YoxC
MVDLVWIALAILILALAALVIALIKILNDIAKALLEEAHTALKTANHILDNVSEITDIALDLSKKISKPLDTAAQILEDTPLKFAPIANELAKTFSPIITLIKLFKKTSADVNEYKTSKKPSKRKLKKARKNQD